MIKRSLMLLLIAILVLPTSIMAAEAGSGTIEGRVVNGTVGSSNVTNQEVTLKTSLNSAEVGSATTKTDAEGRFVFNNLATNSTYSYQVTLKFQEADYNSEQLTFADNETSKSVTLTVYDSTMSDEAIKVNAAHTIIYTGQGNLEVVEIFSVSNESDKTYIGSGEVTATGTRRTLKLPLPTKATEVQYGGELMVCCVLPDKESFWDTMPVLPGNKEIAYSYQIGYSGGEYAYSRMVGYPIPAYNLLVQGEGIEAKSNQLTNAGPVTIEGTVFNNFAGANLATGENLAAQLSGLPVIRSQWAAIWIVLLLIILGGGTVYLLRKRKLQPVRVESRPAQRQERLLAELAKLDDDFEDGRISEEVYQRRRTERKTQLVALMQSAKGQSDKR